MLTNVLHVPDFHFNLLSVNKLCMQINGCIIFSPSECILQGPMSQAVVLGRANSGLYHVQLPTAAAAETTPKPLVMMQSESQPVFRQNFHFSDIDFWHLRLGHLSLDRMKQIQLPCNKERTNMICSICPKARLHRQTFL